MEEYKQFPRARSCMMNKPILFVSQIKRKSGCKDGYHAYSHRCGIELLISAFKHIGTDITEDDISTDAKGKPYIDNSKVFFNISHCDGLAVCALSEHPVGVDCECVRKVSPAVMKKCFGSSEIDYVDNSNDKNEAFSRIWTLKESYVKMTGNGISSDITDKCYDLSEGKVLFDSGAEFLHYDCLFDGERYFISISEKTDNNNRINLIQKPYFDIDNKYILLYNVFNN